MGFICLVSVFPTFPRISRKQGLIFNIFGANFFLIAIHQLSKSGIKHRNFAQIFFSPFVIAEKFS